MPVGIYNVKHIFSPLVSRMKGYSRCSLYGMCTSLCSGCYLFFPHPLESCSRTDRSPRSWADLPVISDRVVLFRKAIREEFVSTLGAADSVSQPVGGPVLIYHSLHTDSSNSGS